MNESNPKATRSNTGRNSKGHFAKGNTIAVGASGNPDPRNRFESGNQAARKSGTYANVFLDVSKEMFDWARVATLEDELHLCRTILQTNIQLIEQLESDIYSEKDLALKYRMIDTLCKMDSNTMMWIARIESITKTISRIGLTMALRERERAEEQLAQLQHLVSILSPISM